MMRKRMKRRRKRKKTIWTKVETIDGVCMGECPSMRIAAHNKLPEEGKHLFRCCNLSFE